MPAAALEYYVWETRRRWPDDVIAPDFAPVKRDHGVSFIQGRRIPKELPELEIRYRAGPDARVTDDLVIHRRRCLVHSEALIDTLKRAGVDSIDYFPLRLVNDQTGTVLRTHRAANLLDVVFCLDREQSELEVDDEEPNEIWSIDKMKLIDDRLGESLMFRLGEMREIVIVHESVKQAIERAGLSGPVFLPADGFREYPGESSNNTLGTHDLDPDGAIDVLPDEEDGGEGAVS